MNEQSEFNPNPNQKGINKNWSLFVISFFLCAKFRNLTQMFFMVLVLKKGASRREIQKIEKKLSSRRSIDISKYFGKITLKEDPLSIQKALRNEWK